MVVLRFGGGGSGYLLVVAFDVVLAGCAVPLMAAVYWPSMTPNAGMLSGA